MSQTSKRPGARDISDLKARLGLKKTGARKPAAPGGAVPPPRSKLGGGAIPPPPGAAPPQPAMPVMPDASEDPFGAMNAMAATATVQQAPQIVVVNDGKPVESVSTGSKAGIIAKIAGMLIVPLVFGVVIGKISANAKTHNKGVEDAAVIRDDVKNVGKSLSTLRDALNIGKERGKGGASFVVGDEQLTAELEALELVQPNIEIAFVYSMPAKHVQGVLGYYAQAAAVMDDLKTHIETSKAEAKIIKEGQAKLKGFNPFGYAALLDKPAADADPNQPAAFKLVQLGAPVCEGQTKPNEAGCGGGPIAGFGYRLDETGPWGVKKLAKRAEEALSLDSIVLIDPSSKVTQQVVRGGEATVAEAAYMHRITELEKKLNELLEVRKSLQDQLNSLSDPANKKFTFFM